MRVFPDAPTVPGLTRDLPAGEAPDQVRGEPAAEAMQ